MPSQNKTFPFTLMSGTVYSKQQMLHYLPPTAFINISYSVTKWIRNNLSHFLKLKTVWKRCCALPSSGSRSTHSSSRREKTEKKRIRKIYKACCISMFMAHALGTVFMLHPESRIYYITFIFFVLLQKNLKQRKIKSFLVVPIPLFQRGTAIFSTFPKSFQATIHHRKI